MGRKIDIKIKKFKITFIGKKKQIKWQFKRSDRKNGIMIQIAIKDWNYLEAKATVVSKKKKK